MAPNAYPLLVGDDQTPLIGGAELQQVIVANGLVERGHSVSMICRDFGQADEVEIGGIKVFRAFRLDQGWPMIRFVWPRITSIWRCMAMANAEIYYQRSAAMLTGVTAAFCRRAGKKSIFATAGNPDLERPTSRLRYARDRWMFEYGVRHVDRILVQNEEQARLCRKNFGRDSTLIPNCFPANGRIPPSEGRYVLWVSTIRQLKRPELFLELAKALPHCQFRMIGGPGRGEEGLFETVKARAATLSNVEFLGFVPFARIEGHFDEATMIVNTSESEGFPNTFLQAWSKGIPTLSFVDSGARYSGQPLGRQVKSVEELGHWVEKWTLNEAERSQEGRRCRAYFEGNHSPSGTLRLYEQVFSELMTVDVNAR